MSTYEILGWINVTIFVLLVVKVPLKFVNRRYKNKGLAKLNAVLTRYHKYLGILMIFSAILHGILTGANIFTVNSGTLILVTVLLTSIFGYMVRVVKKRFVLTIHRILSIIVLVLMLNHIFF